MSPASLAGDVNLEAGACCRRQRHKNRARRKAGRLRLVGIWDNLEVDLADPGDLVGRGPHASGEGCEHHQRRFYRASLT